MRLRYNIPTVINKVY